MSDPKEKKERILTAAQEIFGRHGYSGATMKMIAEKAGVAFGLVSHYYGSKEKLFMTAGFEMVNSLLSTVREGSKDAPDGLSSVRAFIKEYLGFTMRHNQTFPILLHCSPFSDVYMSWDRRAIADKFRELITELDRYIVKGMADGSIREVPSTDTAHCIYGAIVGAVRTRMVAGYDVPNLFDETLAFATRSLAADPEKYQ